MYQSVYDKPSALHFVYPAQYQRESYINHCLENYSILSGQHVGRSLNPRSWIGRVSIDYRSISDLGISEHEYARSPNLGVPAALLDSQDKCWSLSLVCSRSHSTGECTCTCFRQITYPELVAGLPPATPRPNICYGVTLVESCIMLSTALAICIGSVGNASLALMSTFDLEW